MDHHNIEFILSFKKHFILYVRMFCLYVCLCITIVHCLWRPEEYTGFLQTDLQMVASRCFNLNLGPLEENLVSEFLHSKISLPWVHEIYLFFKTRSHVAQVKMTIDSWSSCFYIRSVGITGIHYLTQLWHFKWESGEGWKMHLLWTPTHWAAPITVLRYFCSHIRNSVRSVCYSIRGESSFS